MSVIIEIKNLQKVYATGHTALENIDLSIHEGEILALLGPNGAGKTTLISTVCGIIQKSAGSITVAGFDIEKNYKDSRRLIGLVPQELTTDAFESVWTTVNLSRGLFGKPKNPGYIEEILKSLSLWDKRNATMMTLSGGMKRRVMIAKALAHEPQILFLDEPTAGVDVSLRQDMWQLIERLSARNVTIILTTHYIEEAELLADRIGIIDHGKLIVLKEKSLLMKELGMQQLELQLRTPLITLPASLDNFDCHLSEDKTQLHYTYQAVEEAPDRGIDSFLRQVSDANIQYTNITTHKSSLEDIFVSLIKPKEALK